MRDSTVPTHSLLLSEIEVQEGRGRLRFDEIHAMAEEIKSNGLIHPILVSKSNGKYTLVSGERRLRAYRLLWMESEDKSPWTHIDARIREELSPLQMKVIELHENVFRKDLQDLESFELIRQINELKKEQYGEGGRGKDGGWKQQDLANLLGESRERVGAKLRVAEAVRKNPELKIKFKDKPINAITRELDKIETRQRIERLQASGELKVDTQLVLGDSREEIKKLASSSVQLVLTDPPFGIQRITENEGMNRGGTHAMSYTGDLKEHDNSDLVSASKLMFDMTKEFARVLRPGGHFYIFCCYDLYPSLVSSVRLNEELDFDPVLLTWDKGETTAPFGGYRYSPCSEPILFGWKKDSSHPQGYGRLLNGPSSTLLRFKPEPGPHPFAKPRDLCKFLIKQSTNPGELVIDPFAGSGRILLSARELGRSTWGCEIEKDHWQIAQDELTKGSGK